MVDAYRRNLQRSFVDEMERLITPPPRPAAGGGGGGGPAAAVVPRPGDARAMARLELQGVEASVRAGLPRVTDRATRAHFLDTQARIDQILNPR